LINIFYDKNLEINCENKLLGFAYLSLFLYTKNKERVWITEKLEMSFILE
jgi:hypothetical protein